MVSQNHGAEEMESGAGGEIHRKLTPSREPCATCVAQLRQRSSDPPHARLMIMNSGPLGSLLGGGSETRYLCLDCGNIVMHSTGPYGFGWH